MRGIISLGAIGLMTSASVMALAPTSAAAVTPIEFVSQQMSQFPKSLLGSPTVSVGDEVVMPDDSAEGGSADPAGEPVDDSAAATQSQTTVNSTQSLADSLRESLLSNESANDTAPEGEAVTEEQVAEVTTEAANGSASSADDPAPEGDDASAAQPVETASAGNSSSGTPSGGVDVNAMLNSRLSELKTGDGSESEVDATSAQTDVQSTDTVGGGSQAPGVRTGAAASKAIESTGFNLLNETQESDTTSTGNETTETATDGGGGDATGEAPATDSVATAEEAVTSDPPVSGRSKANALLESRLRELMKSTDETATESDASTGEETAGTQTSDPVDPVTTADAEPAADEAAAADEATSDPPVSGRSKANALLEARLQEIVTGTDETSTESGSDPSEETADTGTADPVESTDPPAADTPKTGGFSKLRTMLESRIHDIMKTTDEMTETESDPLAEEDANGAQSGEDPATPEPTTGSMSDKPVSPKEALENRLREIVTGGEDTSGTGTSTADDEMPGTNGDGSDVSVVDHASNPVNSSGPVDEAVSTAPEPSTWIMMILGFWMAAWRLRRVKEEVSTPVSV